MRPPQSTRSGGLGVWQGTLEPQARSQHCHCIIPHTPRETEVQQGHEVVTLGRYWSWQVRSRGWARGWLLQTELPCSGVWTQRSPQEDDPHKGAAEVPVSIFFGEPGLAHSNVGGGGSLPCPLSGSADLPSCPALSCPRKVQSMTFSVACKTHREKLRLFLPEK